MITMQVSLPDRIAELIEKHGSLRAAARFLEIDPGYRDRQFAFRALSQCPAVGERCVFNDIRYVVSVVEWCLDDDASNLGGTRVNIELEELT